MGVAGGGVLGYMYMKRTRRTLEQNIVIFMLIYFFYKIYIETSGEVCNTFSLSMNYNYVSHDQ